MSFYNNQFGNQFGNPYMLGGGFQQPQMMQQQQMPKTSIIHVNGIQGANAFQMAPNSDVLLLDDTAPIIWLAQTDGAGYKTVTPYDITPHQEQQAIDLSSLEARIKKLEALLYDEPDSSKAQQQSAAK